MLKKGFYNSYGWILLVNTYIEICSAINIFEYVNSKYRIETLSNPKFHACQLQQKRMWQKMKTLSTKYISITLDEFYS